MSYRLLTLAVAGSLLLGLATPVTAKPHRFRILSPSPVISYPAVPVPTDRLLPPPQENRYFPMRVDGQAFMLDIDNTINVTDILNRTYFDPDWTGLVWGRSRTSR
jgi:hypothetical protein